MQNDQLPQLLKKSDLCARLSTSPRTIENMVKNGDFPPPVRIGKFVYWSEKTVCLWQQRMFSEQENWGNCQ